MEKYWGFDESKMSEGLKKSMEAFNVGYSKLNNGEYKEAIEWYSKAIEIAGVDAYYGAFDNRGIAKCAIQDYEGAIEDFQIFIRKIESNPELNADLSNTYYNLGYSYQEICKYNEALEAFQKALELNPYDEDVQGKILYLKLFCIK